jgi:hypothetical protein
MGDDFRLILVLSFHILGPTLVLDSTDRVVGDSAGWTRGTAISLHGRGEDDSFTSHQRV